MAKPHRTVRPGVGPVQLAWEAFAQLVQAEGAGPDDLAVMHPIFYSGAQSVLLTLELLLETTPPEAMVRVLAAAVTVMDAEVHQTFGAHTATVRRPGGRA